MYMVNYTVLNHTSSLILVSPSEAFTFCFEPYWL